MDYEEYMRSVLGYNQMPNNLYTTNYDDYYYDMSYLNNNNNTNTELIESMYPEIYRIVYPMVCKICNQNSNREITRELVDNMTEEIYVNIEAEDTRSATSTVARPVLKNGDVRNPNAKEPEVRGENRQRNFLLRDLIRILILRELLNRPNRPGQMPGPMPPPRPPRPPRPPQMPYNQRPPMWRQY